MNVIIGLLRVKGHKRLRSFLLFLLLIGLHNKVSSQYFISKDSLPFRFSESWRFYPGDSAPLSRIDFDDSHLESISSKLYIEKTPSFNGIAWFRYHFIADSTIVEKPMAFTLKQTGASEIYLDGKLIKTFGTIKDSAGCVYYNPQELPFVVMLNSSKEHVIAVRYANYDATYNSKNYNSPSAGFQLLIGEADSLINQYQFKSIFLSVVLIALLGIFFVLCLLHLFMYVFYPLSKSNLYFSLLMFCAALGCLIGFISFFNNHPGLVFKFKYLNNYLFCFGSISLSFFINNLFTKGNKIRRGIILTIAAASILLRILHVNIYQLASLVLIVFVLIEAAVIIIMALKRRVRGARIIGAGILFFTLFLLSIIVFTLVSVLVYGDADLNDNTLTGQIILILSGIAILSIPLSMSVYLAWSFGSINKDLEMQFFQVQQLSQKNLEQEQEKVRLISGQKEMLEIKVEERTLQLKTEKKKSDDLLLNILPEEVAEELKQTGKSEARLYDEVSVLFTDFTNFTGISQTLTPKELVNEIDICFKVFDEIITRKGLEKIKTIGDAYMAVCGLPVTNPNHAIQTIQAAMEILEYVNERRRKGGLFDIRIGVNSGPVIAGIVGIKKFAYDIWGDTVNTAARMEQNSESGKINISGSTYELVKDKFECIHRGKIAAKNKGEIDMYFVSRSFSEG